MTTLSEKRTQPCTKEDLERVLYMVITWLRAEEGVPPSYYCLEASDEYNILRWYEEQPEGKI